MAVIFEMVGGRTCLDFVNTGSQRRNGPFSEKLQSYEDLLIWAVAAEQLKEEEAEGLAAQAQGAPADAEGILQRARSLRESIYRVFSALSTGAEPSSDDLQLISDEYARAAPYRVLTSTGVGSCTFEWNRSDLLDRPLWPVAVSAVNLASSVDAARVKECGNDNCNWLFLDTSKNKSRRWCDMKECGNREKARRHYHRRRAPDRC